MDQKQIARLDYRKNLIVDPNNPILIQKAWRDRYSHSSHWREGYGGEAYLSRINSEDALTWNVFRSLQQMGDKGLRVVEEVFEVGRISNLLFWGCDIEACSDTQQILNSLIRGIDGRHGGTMTEPDLVIVTDSEVAFVECKLNKNGNQSPWKSQGPGAAKRFNTYVNECGFSELRGINSWKDVYQLIRQYIYAKSLAEILKKHPIVFALIHEAHVDDWTHFYNPLTVFAPKIFRPFVTWQSMRDKIRNFGNIRLAVKMDEALQAASS